MLTAKHSLDLTASQLAVINAALDTQEKILTVQSRAGSDPAANDQLSKLQSVLRTLRRQTPLVRPSQSWGDVARSLFF